jgi:pyridoxal phosphate-dependent aminotransferase EpsN
VKRIYLSVPHMGGDEETFVRDAFASNQLSSVGSQLDAFEYEMSNLVGLPSVALSSGTAALHLGLRLLGVTPGDEVVTPTLTFVASVNPIRYLGGKPIFIDSERASWNLDPELLSGFLKKRAARNRLPRAVVVVHLYGRSADLDPIFDICDRYEVPVLEDAAQAVGAIYKGKHVGSRGAVSAFSFNGNKIITTTGGGMLMAQRQDFVDKARFWSTQARDPGIAYEHSELGYNYRLSNVLAAIGRGQLRVLGERLQQRRAVFVRYRDAFADLPGIEPMPEPPWGVHTSWLSCFLIDQAQFGASRDNVLDALAAQDIEARPVWKPMHMQPLWVGAERLGGSIAEELFEMGICLPSSSSMTLAEQERVMAIIRGQCRGRVARSVSSASSK